MMLAAWYHSVTALLFAVVAILLIIVILLQRGKGVGLAGAFGGTGGHAAFGAKTGDFLTWVTVALAAFVLLFAVLLNFVFRQPEKPDLGVGTPGQPGGSGHLEQPGSAPTYARTAVFGEDAG